MQIRENVTNVYLKRCIIMCEKRAVLCHMPVLVMKGAVWEMRRIFCKPYYDISANSHQISSAVGLSQSAV